MSTRALFLAALFLFAACEQPPASPPNIIYILADDLGYREVGAYGQKLIRTPNMDRLAAEGMRFTRHYSGSPVCAPSRGVLLTGKHTGHGYVRDNYEMGGWGPDEPEGQLPLPDAEVTIAELLKQKGYATAAVGKWGLGGPASEGHPNRQGFDLFYGYLCQRVAHNYYPTHLWHNDQPDSLEGNTWFSAHQTLEAPLASKAEYDARYGGEVFAADPMIEHALSFIETNRERPFFLLFESPIPHLALQIPDEDLAVYAGAFEEEPYLGGNGYLPHPTPRAAYAAMITRLDRDIGLMLDALDRLGLAENTLVMVSSDNGTTLLPQVDFDFFESVGDLRGLKGSVYEGGIRVPFIVRWPGQTPAGTTSDYPSAFWDILPTLAEITNVPAPDDVDGLSLLPTLTGRPDDQPAHDFLYWEYHSRGGMQAVQWDDWKAVRVGLRQNPDTTIALYNLAQDESESADVSADHPDEVAHARSLFATRTRSPIDRWNFE